MDEAWQESPSIVQITTTPDAREVWSMDVHPTGAWIISTNHMGSFRAWNWSLVQDYEAVSLISELCRAELVSNLSSRELETLCGRSTNYLPSYHTAKFVTREKWLVTGDYNGGIHVYSYDKNQHVKSFDAHNSCITTLVVHPTDPFVLSSSDDGDYRIKLWDWDNGWECTRTFQGHTAKVTQVTFNPEDNDSFASASWDGTVKIWSICSGDPSNIITLKLKGHKDRYVPEGLLCVDYFTRHNQQHLIVGCKDKTAQIWKLGMKECVDKLEGHTDRITAVNLHPKLPVLITGSLDGTVRIWNSTTYKLENIIDFSLGAVYAFGCIKDSTRIVVGCRGGIARVDVSSARTVRIVRAPDSWPSPLISGFPSDRARLIMEERPSDFFSNFMSGGFWSSPAWPVLKETHGMRCSQGEAVQIIMRKNFCSLFDRLNIPRVDLIWSTYSSNVTKYGNHLEGSFWWRSSRHLLELYQSMERCNMVDSKSAYFWIDRWHGNCLLTKFPHLITYAENVNLTVHQILKHEFLKDLFQLPLSQQAHNEFMQVEYLCDRVRGQDQEDSSNLWIYFRDSQKDSSIRAYKVLVGHQSTPRRFQWIWRTSCQQKHKVFFWLLLHDRLNTRNLLRRKNFILQNYNCANLNCLEEETVVHLFWNCPFAVTCWDFVCPQRRTNLSVLEGFDEIKQKLNVPFFMEIIVLAAWSIWIIRNNKIFRNEAPSFQRWKIIYLNELSLVGHRARTKYAQQFRDWLVEQM